MRIDIVVSVHQGKRTSPIAFMAYVSDSEIYSALAELAVEHLGVRPPVRDYIGVITPETNPHLPEFFALLAKAGWKPFYGYFIPKELKDSHFLVSHIRRYEKNDLDKPEYLAIERWGIAVFDHVEIRDGLYVGAVRRTKWKNRIGFSNKARGKYVSSPFFVNDELKRDIEAAGLIGLTFLPVLWDQPDKAKGAFWQLSSSITMPRCLLPIIDLPDDTMVRVYDDGGHWKRQLVFRRSEVKAMEPFDVALTSEEEDIHFGPDSWTRNVVISQRCRKVFNKLKLTSASLSAVRLEADDWKQTDSDHQR